MKETAWLELNQQSLTAALEQVRIALQSHLTPDAPASIPSNPVAVFPSDYSSALDVLCETFSLSPFERGVLLLCAGVELDSKIGSLCAAAPNAQPTFSLALAALPDPHWNALAPQASLRYWRLIEVGNGPSLTHSPLRIDERILHFLAGLHGIDERLTGWLEPLSHKAELLPSQQLIADEITTIWMRTQSVVAAPIIQLFDGDINTQLLIATAACHALDLETYLMIGNDLPVNSTELALLIRLWEREIALARRVLIVDASHIDDRETGSYTRLVHLLDRVRGPLIVLGMSRRLLLQRSLVGVNVPGLTTGEQRDLWTQALGPAAQRLNGHLDRLVTQFRLNPLQVRAATTEVQQQAHTSDDLAAALWVASQHQARPHLDDLAQRLEPQAVWDDLILPDRYKQTLHEIVAHVRQRDKVYEKWGFRARSLNGLGITALFAGESGTGKTMAAEVLANELYLDLYRIDLSQVVSKYIGETEKNLRHVFDAAETGGAILLFDEADALFGKRSEVKDSHDRYANIEVSYLLQRMEAYRGLAILTTNMKNAIDSAFLRRLRFIVHFPFPDARQRAEIWQRIFPRSTPIEQLDFGRLARLNVAGGSIRNIALNAAFLAADGSQSIQMIHLLQATRSEYAKLEKPLTDAEVKDWVVMSEKR